MTTKKQPIILDCDPGVDDAFALAIAAFSDKLEILAVHTVAGNVSLEHTTRNARGLVKLLGLEVPIAVGAAEPLLFEPFFATEVHGENGFGDVELTDLAPVSELTALASYVEILTKAKEKVTIVATGPLTNVALLLKSYPHLKEKIAKISLMGGGLKGGNTTSAGEFNFYFDPHAAQIVFTSGLPIVMAGLDATEQSEFTQAHAEQLKREGGALGELLHAISQAALAFNQNVNGSDFMSLHDVMSVVYLIEPSLFKTKEASVQVIYEEGVMRGFSHVDQRRSRPTGPNATVLIGLDKEAFMENVLRVLTNK